MNKEASVYIVDGLRTPFVKAVSKPNPLSAVELAVAAAGPLLARQPFSPTDLSEVVVGCVGPAADETNIGRILALRLGCGKAVPGWTVQRNCASGLQALACGAADIISGRYDLVLAGGTECMSRAPFIYPNAFAEWLVNFRRSKHFLDKLKVLARFRPKLLVPVISLLKALTDPVVNLSMGQTAENLAYEFNITREEADTYALQSHRRAYEAMKHGLLNEIIPLFDWQGNVLEGDTGVRSDTSLEKLAMLKPNFDKPFGLVTAGNSSQVTDGAAFLILASAHAVKQYNLPVLGRMVDVAWAALDPAMMGLGPAYAIQKLLAQQNLQVENIDYWEINEAFAAQVLACLKVMQDETYCKNYLKVEHPLGRIPLERLNVDGGAIAIGHPVGASGARLVLHLLQVLKRNKAQRGIASLCIGGGQGGAVLIERVEGEIS